MLPSRQPVSSPVSTAGQGRDKPYGILYAKGASVIRSLAALMAGYRDRYFTEALPALVTRKLAWSRSRLGSELFPATLVSEATIEAADAAEPPDNLLRLAVAEQATIMRRRLTARR